MSKAQTIRMENDSLHVPNNPVIPYIEGDGIGSDIWNASVNVFDNAVDKAYGGTKKINWLEILAGEKAFNQKDLDDRKTFIECFTNDFNLKNLQKEMFKSNYS